MSTYKTQGIIIKRSNFGESSLMLNIYTKDFGKIEAVARGARKAKGKLKGHLELFLLADLVLANGRSIDTITSSVAAENFLNLRNNLEISFGAYYIIELADRMIMQEHKDERVFYLLKKALLFLDGLASRNFNTSTETKATHRCVAFKDIPEKLNLDLLILLFQIHLLNLSGFSPELDKCVICSKPIAPGENYFSLKLGGVAGKECVYKVPEAVLISDNAIKLIRLFQFKGNSKLENYARCLDKHFEIINKLKADERLVLDAVFLMNKFIEFNIERKVKGVDFIYR